MEGEHRAVSLRDGNLVEDEEASNKILQDFHIEPDALYRSRSPERKLNSFKVHAFAYYETGSRLSVREWQQTKNPDPKLTPYSTRRVYIDEDGVVYDSLLRNVDVSKNANKTYVMQLLVSDQHDTEASYCIFTSWLRDCLGDGQAKLYKNYSLQDCKQLC